jgi:hypothetical protein
MPPHVMRDVVMQLDEVGMTVSIQITSQSLLIMGRPWTAGTCIGTPDQTEFTGRMRHS